MKSSLINRMIVLLLILGIMPVSCALAWTDQAHMAMGMAAGFKCFQNCAAPDLSHTVAVMNGLPKTDTQAHFFNVPSAYILTADDVYSQLQDIGMTQDECPNGYLLGAILHAARLCKARTESGAYDDEYYAVLLHYVADLSQPLHMSDYDAFNRKNHFVCDHILSDNNAAYPVFAAVALAFELTVDDQLSFSSEQDLVNAIVLLARQSQETAKQMRDEGRILTREEAMLQLSRAATLGRAILLYCGKIE